MWLTWAMWALTAMTALTVMVVFKINRKLATLVTITAMLPHSSATPISEIVKNTDYDEDCSGPIHNWIALILLVVQTLVFATLCRQHIKLSALICIIRSIPETMAEKIKKEIKTEVISHDDGITLGSFLVAILIACLVAGFIINKIKFEEACKAVQEDLNAFKNVHEHDKRHRRTLIYHKIQVNRYYYRAFQYMSVQFFRLQKQRANLTPTHCMDFSGGKWPGYDEAYDILTRSGTIYHITIDEGDFAEAKELLHSLSGGVSVYCKPPIITDVLETLPDKPDQKKDEVTDSSGDELDDKVEKENKERSSGIIYKTEVQVSQVPLDNNFASSAESLLPPGFKRVPCDKLISSSELQVQRKKNKRRSRSKEKKTRRRTPSPPPAVPNDQFQQNLLRRMEERGSTGRPPNPIVTLPAMSPLITNTGPTGSVSSGQSF